MKSIQNQYRDLQEGRMTQSNFMRNVRMTLPQYITSVTSFKDTVKILTNKGILNEAIIISKTDAEDGGWDDAYEKTFDTFDPSEESSDDAEFDALIKKIEDEMAGEEAVKSQYDETLNEAKEAMPKGNSGKELYDEFAEADNLNQQEIITGITIEHGLAPEKSYNEIAKLVIKNVKKDSQYYTNWKLSGVKGYEPKYMDNVNPDDYRMKFLEKDNLIDKPNVMKPVKGFNNAKADANKAKKETNNTVKDVEELGVVAKSTRGVQKMDATGTQMKKIVMKENNGGYGDESPEEYANMLAQAKEFIRKNKKPQPIPTSDQGYGDETPEEFANMQKGVKGLTKNDIIKMVREIMAESGIDGGDNLIDDEQTSMY